jgi:hypothetical protein
MSPELLATRLTKWTPKSLGAAGKSPLTNTSSSPSSSPPAAGGAAPERRPTVHGSHTRRWISLRRRAYRLAISTHSCLQPDKARLRRLIRTGVLLAFGALSTSRERARVQCDPGVGLSSHSAGEETERVGRLLSGRDMGRLPTQGGHENAAGGSSLARVAAPLHGVLAMPSPSF